MKHLLLIPLIPANIIKQSDYKEYVEETNPLDSNDYPSEELGFLGVAWYWWTFMVVLLAAGAILFFFILKRRKI